MSERAIWLRREGDRVVVSVEHKEMWIDVISESAGGPFSHIVEPAGIEKCINEPRRTPVPRDL